MPTVRIDDTLEMFYELDNFVEPWKKPETILLVHGIGGCTTEWFPWVPLLAGRYAVLRVDLRGWGRSTIPPEGYPWSMDNFAADLKVLMDRLGLDKVHMVGAKMGGRVAIHFARHHPERLHSTTLINTPMALTHMKNASRDDAPKAEAGREGLERWCRATMEERIGKVEPAKMEWWVQLYAGQSPRVTSEVFDLAWGGDETENLKAIRTPVLVLDSKAHPRRSLDGIIKWQSLLADSKLVIIPVANNGRMIMVSEPQKCAAALLEYLEALGQRRM